MTEKELLEILDGMNKNTEGLVRVIEVQNDRIALLERELLTLRQRTLKGWVIGE